jgi:hypothetical protein
MIFTSLALHASLSSYVNYPENRIAARGFKFDGNKGVLTNSEPSSHTSRHPNPNPMKGPYKIYTLQSVDPSLSSFVPYQRPKNQNSVPENKTRNATKLIFPKVKHLATPQNKQGPNSTQSCSGSGRCCRTLSRPTCPPSKSQNKISTIGE